MKKAISGFIALTAFGLACADGHQPIGATAEDRIALAMKAAPGNVSGDAKIMEMDGSLLREGSNGWTCMPGVPPNFENPMCVDAAWMKWLDAYMNKKPFTPGSEMGISYMLVGDVPVDNDDPYGMDPAVNTWIKEGPHLMILLPLEMLEGMPTDPYGGGPYVMWAGSEFAHIMVPLEVTQPIAQ